MDLLSRSTNRRTKISCFVSVLSNDPDSRPSVNRGFLNFCPLESNYDAMISNLIFQFLLGAHFHCPLCNVLGGSTTNNLRISTISSKCHTNILITNILITIKEITTITTKIGAPAVQAAVQMFNLMETSMMMFVRINS